MSSGSTPESGRAAGKWSDLGVRSLSAVLLIPLALLDVWSGGAWFSVMVLLIGILIAHEWISIGREGHTLQFAILSCAALVAGLVPQQVGYGPALLALVILWVASFAHGIALAPAKTRAVDLGVPYVAVPVMALVMLRNDSALGLTAIVWLLVTVWAADILAYFAGRLIGGPKLAPVLSPKKTWAGLGGAVAGAALASWVVATFFLTGRVWPVVLLAAVFAVIEQAGDIFESMYKRRHGVKDSGSLIPGHGGAMDRLDGLIAVAAAAWLVGVLRNPEAPAAGLLNW